MRGQLQINGEPYTLVDDSRINTRRPNYTESMRPSQPSEARLNTKTWQLSGPIGNSRQINFGDPLGVDYTIDLDGRNAGLLTSVAARTAVSLTSLGLFEVEVPTSDALKTNWSEGAGDGDGDAFDELDEGVLLAGSSDNEATYWTTTTNDAELRLGFPAPAGDVETTYDPSNPLAVNFRLRSASASPSYTFALYENTTVLAQLTTPTIFPANTWATFSVSSWSATILAGVTLANVKVGVQRTSGTGAFDVSAVEIKYPLTSSVLTIDEDRDQLFVQRGTHSTQVNPPDMTEVQDVDHGATVTDSIASWRGNGYVALGATALKERSAVVAATSATYGNIASVDADKLAIGPDRLWLSDASDGLVKYIPASLAVSSANVSNGIEVADTNSGTITGLYTLGELMIAGTQRGPRSFTDAGAPAVLGESVKDFPSALNGAAGDSLWGWHYHATQLGLYAISPDGRVENPVGPGEDEAGRRFEGPIDGYPAAVKAFKDSLWVSYVTPEGDSFLLRGVFNPRVTPGSGRPDWYVFRKLTGLICTAIGATTGRAVPAIVWGEDSNIAYADLAFRGREIADTTNYTYNTSGGSWFGTTLVLPVGLIGNVRWAKFFTENMATGENFWACTFDINDSGSFTNISSSTDQDGLQTLNPATSTRLGAFHTLKPKLTQIATASDASTSPPQIRGDLTVAFDERPEHVREITAVVEVNGGDLATLQALADAGQNAPVSLRLPADTTVNTDRFCYVVDVEFEALRDSDDQAVRLTIIEWATS